MITDIIIPVWNQPEYTEQCVDSILKYTKNYRIIFVDDGSESPTADLLKSFLSSGDGKWKLIRNPTNLGFAKSINKGMRISDAERMCWLNNDTVVTKNWLCHLNDTMTRFQDEKCGFVVPNSTFQYNSRMRKLIGRCPKEDVLLDHVLGFCFLVDRRVINKIGYVDEIYSEGYGYDETDYFLRAQNQGFTARLSHKAYVYHRAYTTFEARNPGKLKELFMKNHRIFVKKWYPQMRIE